MWVTCLFHGHPKFRSMWSTFADSASHFAAFWTCSGFTPIKLGGSERLDASELAYLESVAMLLQERPCGDHL